MLTEGRLDEMVPIHNGGMKDRTFIEWDKDDIEALGILKVDVLGLGMLSCLRRSFELLRRHAGLSLDLALLPKECAETYGMLCRADSVGVFQVESRAQMNMLPRLQPRQFYDLVIEVAIVRPGPIAGGMVHPFLRRKSGQEPEEYPSPWPQEGPPDELYQVLHKTLGVPLFQEQAMRIAIVAARFTPDEADQLRRAMATFKAQGQVEKYREKLVAGMVRRGYERAFADRVFAQIEGFGSYGFPESHAASFAHLVYASAWMKCHHPAVFACALLNSQPMGFYAPAQLVRDAREHGVAIHPIDVNASAWDCTLEAHGGSSGGLALRLGLRMVAGLAREDAAALLAVRQARNGAPFASVEELAWRAGIGRRGLNALAAADCFAGLGTGRRHAAWEASGVAEGPQALPLFAAAIDPLAREASLMPEAAVPLPPLTPGEMVVEDYRTTGLTLRQHPLALLRPQLRDYADTRRLQEVPSGTSLRVPGLVLMRQRPGSAHGVVFLTIEDEHGTGNLVVYPDVALRCRAALIAGRLLLAEGRVERVTEHTRVPITHLVIRRLVDRSDLLDSLLSPGDAAGDTGWTERNLGRADEVRRPEPERRPPRAGLPGSRDFR